MWDAGPGHANKPAPRLEAELTHEADGRCVAGHIPEYVFVLVESEEAGEQEPGGRFLDPHRAVSDGHGRGEIIDSP